MDYKQQQRRIADIAAFYADDYAQRQGAMSPPIYQSSIFVPLDPPNPFHYTRVSNPTIEIGEKKIAKMENGEQALFVSSGMSAISLAILTCVSAGGHIVTLNNVYPGSMSQFEYLKTLNISVSHVRGTHIEDFEVALRPNTQLLYLESPSSYMFEIQDLEEVVRLARHRGIKTMIDNSWATPVFQNPLDFGIDLVVHSISKYIGGHSDLIAGTLIGREEELMQKAAGIRSNFGFVMDPHQAWLVVRGIRSLALRMEKHRDNSLKVASFLESHPCIAEVIHPGLPSYPQKKLAEKYLYGSSGLFSFTTKGTLEQSRNAVQDTSIFQKTVSWGGYDSLLSAYGCSSKESAATNHVKAGLIRASIGLESPESLMEALDEALRKNVKTN